MATFSPDDFDPNSANGPDVRKVRSISLTDKGTFENPLSEVDKQRLKLYADVVATSHGISSSLRRDGLLTTMKRIEDYYFY